MDDQGRAVISPTQTFYGPHACAQCGEMIVKVSVEEGGAEYDQPTGPIYPNTVWHVHVCHAAARG